jgi:phosphoserine phosphatase
MVVFLLILSCRCEKDEVPVSNALNRLNWSENNFTVLNKLIQENGRGGKYFNESKKPYAVLDWDQTCAHFDAEEALMRFQLSHLRFKISKEQFKGLLNENINGIVQLSADYQNVRLADINQDLSNDYNFLYDQYSGLNGKMTLEEVQASPQYQDFIAKIPFLYGGYCDTPGIGAEYGYPWVLYLFTGYTLDEVKSMAKEAISLELSNQLSKQTWQSPANFRTKAGMISYSFKTGLRVFSEMQDLINTFKDNGIDVFVVSASFKPVIEVFSGVGTFGYNVSPGNVIAMELSTSIDGKILPTYKAGWFKTQRQGKVDAINKIIKQELGKNWDPLFSAGDSDGDYEMSTGFPDMKLTLIWNRVKGGDIGKLCKQAVAEMNSANPRYILQGRNENTGVVLQSSESILFGKTAPQLLY